MANFFSKYPKLLYSNRVVTDIISRIAVREKYTNQVQLYYEYDLQEGDTPEIIASKYYNDAEKHWIVLLMNDIVDPFFDFPLSYSDFDSYVNQKYASLGEAQGISGSDYARKTLNPAPFSYRAHIKTTDLISDETTINTFFIDEAAYLSQHSNPALNFPHYTNQVGSIFYEQTTEPVYIYDYELEKNESKRKIKLLRAEYAEQFQKELKSLMSLKYV